MIIEGLINLAYGGGALGNVLAQWEAAGVFSYALPFLLIFALVFAILGVIPLFSNNKAINAVISLTTALMALQFNFVSAFFSEIFPRLGVGLAVILVLIIFLGLFIKDEEKGNQIIKWMLAIVSVIVAIVVISNSFSSFGYGFGGGQFWNFLRYNAATIIGIMVGLGFLIWVIAAQNPKSEVKGAKMGKLAYVPE